MKSVLLIGATGLVGRSCLNYLLSEKWVGMVTVLTRRPVDIKHKKLICEVVDFEHIEKYKRRIKCDVMISAFGTTIKKAGHDKDIFYKWEVDYPLNTAKIAFDNGCRHFSFVSAAGVSEKSLFFYSKTKGKMEELAGKIGFETLDIFKPSFLLGNRNEHRPAEAIVEKILPAMNFLFKGPFEKYSPIEADSVALAIVKQAENPVPGVHRYHWREMKAICN
ncbi:MAG: NAD-dependent epimerase/dehydratase family protein [Spirochaetia bacterium]|nr:NAD-dependent epimerase/dehydratase family protein [Spirochaetia bacterium]